MKKFIYLFAILGSVQMVSAQNFQHHWVTSVKLGTPYFTEYHNVRPSNFSSLSFGSKWTKEASGFSLTPTLSVDRYLFVTDYYFSRGAEGYSFVNSQLGYSVNKIQLYTATFGVALGLQKKFGQHKLFEAIAEPQIGKGIDNRHIFLSSQGMKVNEVNNNPLLFGVNSGFLLTNVLGHSTFSIGIFENTVYGNYTPGKRFRIMTPSIGLVRGF